MKRPLNVFFAIGQYFIQYFTVSLTSLLETNKDLDLKVYLIYDFSEIGLLKEVLEFAQTNYNININLIYQDIAIFKNFRIAKHVSVNTYLRLLLAEIIPADVESGLFIDSDTVVTSSLSALAAITFPSIDAVNDEEKYVYAVREIPEQNEANSKRLTALGYPITKYFNAGVMLISLKNWRLKGVSDDLLHLATKHMNDLVFWDQDVLNMYFANRWKELDPTYNALHLLWKLTKTPAIVHFAGSSKPWNYLNRHPYKSYYFKYFKISPYKGKKYVDFSYKKLPYKYYRDARHFLNYFRQLFLGNINK